MKLSVIVAMGAMAAMGLVSVACNNGDDPGGSGGATAGGSTEAGPPCGGANHTTACYDCEQQACPDEFATQLTACKAFLDCEAQCTCSDIGCLEGCAGKIDAACQKANDAAVACTGHTCDVACATTGGTMDAPHCDQLETCCAKQIDSVKQGCETVVNAKSDSICEQQLAAYTAAMLCN